MDLSHPELEKKLKGRVKRKLENGNGTRPISRAIMAKAAAAKKAAEDTEEDEQPEEETPSPEE